MSTIILGLAESSIQLVPDGTILLHVLLILVMVGILNKTLFQPIHRIFEEREREGLGTLAKASEIRGAIDRRLAACETALRTARADGYRLTEVQRSEELKDREVRLISKEIETARLVEAAKSLIEKQAHEVQLAVAAEAETLATEIRGQILKPLVDFRRVR